MANIIRRVQEYPNGRVFWLQAVPLLTIGLKNVLKSAKTAVVGVANGTICSPFDLTIW
jgi:hypothetical protein